MASWDDEEFETDKGFTAGDKWGGEDEDSDGLKDNWDDEEEEEAPAEVKTEVKKKKTLQEKIKEREAKALVEKLEKEEERKRQEAELVELSPEEAMSLKLENQRKAEESDLQLAIEAFGIDDPADPVGGVGAGAAPAPLPGQMTIDNFRATDKAEFDELRALIVKKLAAFEASKCYPLFLEQLFRELAAGVDSHEDIKKMSAALTVLAQEKQKAQKAATQGKGKKKPAGKTLAKAGKASNKDDFDTYDDYGDYDDFM